MHIEDSGGGSKSQISAIPVLGLVRPPGTRSRSMHSSEWVMKTAWPLDARLSLKGAGLSGKASVMLFLSPSQKVK